MQSSPSSRRIERVRFDLVQRQVEVLAVRRLSPSFVAVTLGGPELAGFKSLSFDDHLKLMVPDGAGGIQRRDYTPRAFDAGRGELTLEFALHEHGPATDWARRVKPGDRVVIGGPRGSMIIPMDWDWHLLVGDATALPAIARRIEELPATSPVHVIVQVPEVADRRSFAPRPGLTVQWTTHVDAWLAAVAAWRRPSGEGFAWAAGEAGAMQRVRESLRLNGQPKEAMRVAAYWKPGASDFHERLEA